MNIARYSFRFLFLIVATSVLPCGFLMATDSLPLNASVMNLVMVESRGNLSRLGNSKDAAQIRRLIALGNKSQTVETKSNKEKEIAFIDKPINFNSETPDSCISPLVYAVFKNAPKTIAFLISQGADVNQKCKSTNQEDRENKEISLMEFAVEKNNIKSIEALLGHGLSLPDEGAENLAIVQRVRKRSYMRKALYVAVPLWAWLFYEIHKGHKSKRKSLIVKSEAVAVVLQELIDEKAKLEEEIKNSFGHDLECMEEEVSELEQLIIEQEELIGLQKRQLTVLPIKTAFKHLFTLGAGGYVVKEMVDYAY